jgi:DNA ligase-1
MLASPKIDGIRALSDSGTAFSRSGLALPNHYLQECFAALQTDCLDGEIVVGPPNVPDTYKSTRGPIMSFLGQPDFTYWIFDQWAGGPYAERALALREYEKIPWIKVVKQKLVRSTADALAFEEECISLGYEGIMLRRPMALYKQGRSTLREGTLLKLKRFLDDEAEIIGWEERMSNQNEDVKNAFGYAKRSSEAAGLIGCSDLGAWRVRMVTGKFAGVECKVGTGFTATERVSFWRMKEAMLGQKCTIKWFEPGSDKAPRLPSWKGLRGDE